MKVLSTICLCLLMSLVVRAQDGFKAGLIAGISTSQISGDTYSGFTKAGFSGGAFAKRDFNDKWGAEFEILYKQKGSRHLEKGSASTDSSLYLLRLNYIEVPVLVKYYYKKFIFETGPSFGVLANEYEYISTIGDITNIRPFDKTETSFNFGVGYPLLPKLVFDWRYSTSVFPVRKHESGAVYWFNRGQYNSVLSFTLHYQF